MISFINILFASCPVKSASQSGEENMYLTRFKPRHPGTFVEIGALNGHRFSNTRVLNKCHGWSGLLIEANINNYVQLIKMLDRPNITVKHSAVCEPPQRWTKFTLDGGAVSTDVTRVSADFQKIWAKVNHPSHTVKVPCAPMSELIQNMNHIDFFSLDVEGAELSVINTIDFKATQIDTFCIEFDTHDLPKNERIQSILESKGYVRCNIHDKRNAWFNKQCT